MAWEKFTPPVLSPKFPKLNRSMRKQKCRLREVLAVRKLTPIDIAENLDVGESTVANWARGINIPDALVMDDLCTYLHVKVDDLYPRE